MTTDNNRNVPTKPAWHDLAERATHENDGEELCRLVEEMCDSIDASQASKKKPSQPALVSEEQGRSAT